MRIDFYLLNKETKNVRSFMPDDIVSWLAVRTSDLLQIAHKNVEVFSIMLPLRSMMLQSAKSHLANNKLPTKMNILQEYKTIIGRQTVNSKNKSPQIQNSHHIKIISQIHNFTFLKSSYDQRALEIPISLSCIIYIYISLLKKIRSRYLYMFDKTYLSSNKITM